MRTPTLMACVSTLALLAGPSVGRAQDAAARLQQLAADGLNVGRPLMNGSMDVVLEQFGLPERIDILHEQARWDIDLEETPAEWIYSGFSITTLYLREGRTVDGEPHLVPGPYRRGNVVTGVRVSDPGVAVRFDLRVGVDAGTVLDRLGTPARYRRGRSTSIAYRDVPASPRRISVVFRLTEPDGEVREIVWQREPWH